MPYCPKIDPVKAVHYFCGSCGQALSEIAELETDPPMAIDRDGFPSRSAFLRCMVELGIQNLTKDYLQNEEGTQDVGRSDAKTIREMVPEGKENAVDVRNELPEMIENELLDIVDQDPEIKRSGWEVYR
jgi:hypothetical protein